MAGGVLSVKRIAVTLSAGSQGQGTIAPAPDDIGNCVAYITKSITTKGPNEWDDWRDYAIRSKFSSTDKIDITTAATATRVIAVEVTVVEYDPAVYKVQQVDYSIAAPDTSDSASCVSTNLTKAFIYNTYTNDTSGPPWAHNDQGAVSVKFNGTTPSSQIDVALGVTDATVAGTAYIIEAVGTEISVEAIDISIGNTDHTISEVVMAKTFLAVSTTCSGTDDNNSDYPSFELTTTTNVAGDRSGSGGSVSATVYVVEFSGAETVQRGNRNQTSSLATDDITITTVDLDAAWANIPNNPSFKAGKFTGTDSIDNPDAQVRLTFEDDSTLRMTKSTAGGEAANDIPWEVIEWDVDAGGPGPTRRVMVIS